MTTATPNLRAKRHAAVLACLEAGNTPAEIRRKLRVSAWIIRRVRKKAGLPLHGNGTHSKFAERQEQAMELRRQGFSLNEIGARLVPAVTGKRVHQLLKGTGADLRCAECGKPSQRLFFFPKDCSMTGAEGICPGCAQEIKQQQPNQTQETNT